MDPITAAAARVVGYLGPIALGKSVELAKKVGEDAVDKIADWLDGIRKRWADDPTASEAVEAFVEEPADEQKQDALRDVLARRMEDDPELQESVEKLTERVGPYVVVVMEAGEVRIQDGPKIKHMKSGTLESTQNLEKGDRQSGPEIDIIG